MSGNLKSSDKSGCVHVIPLRLEGEFLHYNDAIEDLIVTFFFASPDESLEKAALYVMALHRPRSGVKSSWGTDDA